MIRGDKHDCQKYVIYQMIQFVNDAHVHIKKGLNSYLKFMNLFLSQDMKTAKNVKSGPIFPVKTLET